MLFTDNLVFQPFISKLIHQYSGFLDKDIYTLYGDRFFNNCYSRFSGASRFSKCSYSSYYSDYHCAASIHVTLDLYDEFIRSDPKIRIYPSFDYDGFTHNVFIRRVDDVDHGQLPHPFTRFDPNLTYDHLSLDTRSSDLNSSYSYEYAGRRLINLLPISIFEYFYIVFSYDTYLPVLREENPLLGYSYTAFEGSHNISPTRTYPHFPMIRAVTSSYSSFSDLENRFHNSSPYFGGYPSLIKNVNPFYDKIKPVFSPKHGYFYYNDPTSLKRVNHKFYSENYKDFFSSTLFPKCKMFDNLDTAYDFFWTKLSEFDSSCEKSLTTDDPAASFFVDIVGYISPYKAHRYLKSKGYKFATF